MRRRQFLKAVGIGTAAGVGVPGTATAQDEDEVPEPSAYTTNEALENRLKLLRRESDFISLRRIGRSAGRGDPIWEVTVGEGDTNVHLITQIHGDEPAGTDAVLTVLRQMVYGDPERFGPLLDELTLTIVPRVNPDGAMFSRNVDDDDHEERITRRQNTQPWCEGDSLHEPYYHYADEGDPLGYDMNRDFDILVDPDADEYDREDWWSSSEDDGETEWQFDLRYRDHVLKASGLMLTPEVRAVTKSFLEADPDYAITHHHQGIPTVPDTDPTEPSVMSVMAPFGPAYEEQAPFRDPDAPLADYVNPFIDEATSERSLRLNKLVADALAETTEPWDVFDSVTRFGYTTLWGSYLDALTPLTDAAGMLYEVSGQSDDVGSRAYGLKVETARVGFLETFSALAADPELSDVDAESYFDIPLSGDEYESRTRAREGNRGNRSGAAGASSPASASADRR